MRLRGCGLKLERSRSAKVRARPRRGSGQMRRQTGLYNSELQPGLNPGCSSTMVSLGDVDTGRVTPVKGLGVHGPGPGPVLSVLAVGRDAVVWIDRCGLAGGIPKYDIYLVRHGEAIATRIAVGSNVQPAAGGRSVWGKSFIDAHHCTLREVGLDGRLLRGPLPVPCSAALIDPGAGALLVEGRSGIDPARGRALLRTSRLLAIAGNLALTVRLPHPLTLPDLPTGRPPA